MTGYRDHGCPIRYGLALFGDRWSLLIIRDLMFKQKCRYGEFLTAGEGISTNILADRLGKLESSGIIQKGRDPNHGKKFIYSMTQKGIDLMPVMLSIIDWSEKYDERTEVPPDFAKALRENPEELRKRLIAGVM